MRNKRTPPSLQALVESAGTYFEITPQGWVRWQAEMDKYHAAIRYDESYEPPEDLAP